MDEIIKSFTLPSIILTAIEFGNRKVFHVIWEIAQDLRGLVPVNDLRKMTQNLFFGYFKIAYEIIFEYKSFDGKIDYFKLFLDFSLKFFVWSSKIISLELLFEFFGEL